MGGFSEHLLEASPMPNKMIPPSSKMDLALAEAEFISDGSASGLTHLRRKKIKLLCRRRLKPEKGGARMCERNSSADLKSVKEGQKMPQVVEQTFP